jgi:EpsI family protein
MKPLPLRIIVVVALLLLASAAAAWLKPTQVLRDTQLKLEVLIPASFGDWTIDPTITPIKPSPDVQANLDSIYDQIVSRTYVNKNGQRMMLTVAYGGDQSDALKAHRQEVCYAAQGFTIRRLLHGRLDFAGADIPVTRMLAVQGHRSEPVTYWFTMGDHVVLGRLERLVVQLGYGLRGQIPDGMLVRVSSLDEDADAAWSAQHDFMAAMATSMGAHANRLVGGMGV